MRDRGGPELRANPAWIRVKICGIRDLGGARAVARSGADAVGFVFAASPRRITPEEARRIAADLPEPVERVAVFRLAGPDEIRRVLERFPADRIQVEATDAHWRARFAAQLLPVVHDDGRFSAQLGGIPPGVPVVLEPAGRGGRGRGLDRARAAAVAAVRPVWLAGGLDPGNVGLAIREVRPYGVDVSSGVESSPGVKSPRLVRAFVEAVEATIAEGSVG